MFTELYRKEKREEADRGDQENKGGNQTQRQIHPVYSSLSVLHHPEHTKGFTELAREAKVEGGDRGNLVEKK